jgi:hypothetical protein
MRTRIAFAAAAIAAMTACSALGSGRSIPFTSNGSEVGWLTPDAGGVSVLKSLKKKVTIGSTIPSNGDLNPYGLTVATSSQGKVKKGDLFVCNFNAKSNIQGTGTTIVSLSPTPGSKPNDFAQSGSLLGCAALTATELSSVTYAASFGKTKGTVTQWSPTASMTKMLNKNLVHPWGATWAVASGLYTYAANALFVSDASTGSIVLAASCQGGQCSYPGTVIVKGFAVNHGKPGSILGPSGLTFDPKNCVRLSGTKACGTLYVVDGKTNTVVAIHNALNLRNKNSIIVSANGKSFSGPDGGWAKLLYSGAPLNGPISSTVLFNHNLVVGNTLDPNGKNLLIEISPAGKLLDTVNVDKGAAGALFGLVATGRSVATTKLYFNDDNANNLQALVP